MAKFKVQEIQGSKRTFPYAVKQFVAREIETEKMRRSDSEEIILRSQISNDKASTQVSQKPEDSQKPEFKVPPKPVISVPKIKAVRDYSILMHIDLYSEMTLWLL